MNTSRISDVPHITVSLTTISSRLTNITSTLKSLLSQDYTRFDIRLYLSREGFLLDEGVPGALPSSLNELIRSNPRLSVRFTSNIGPYRKILPALAEMRGKRFLLATADDDSIYPADWLSRLYTAYQTYRCVVCFRGHHMLRQDRVFRPYRRWMRAGIVKNPDLYNLPTGKDGVLYDTGFFHSSVLNHARALELAPTADDLWLKWHYSAFADVPTYVIHPDYKTQSFKDDPFGVSLYDNFNRDGGNDKTIRKLESYVAARGGKPLAERL